MQLKLPGTMTQTVSHKPSKMSDARAREDFVMRTLAGVLRGEASVESVADMAEFRLMGYAASLARGSVNDPGDRLKKLLSVCRKRAQDSDAHVTAARDAVQAKWGSPWHFDAQKIRKELPLYVQRRVA